MPGSLKLMFWNIQNVYDYKIVMPDELELEDQISGDPTMQTKKLRKLEQSSKKIYETKKSDYRRTIASIIGLIDPDVIAIVEFSVGKSDIVESGFLEGAGGKVSQAQVTFDHWGPLQYQVELNDYYKDKLGIDRLWQSRLSKVNCSDLIVYANQATNDINQIQHKNSMFELYGLIWDSKKLVLTDNEFSIASQGVNGKLNFPERAPGFAHFFDLRGNRFSLVMIHSVFGKGSQAQVIQQRALAIKHISQLAVVNLAAKGDPNAKPQPIAPSPIVVAGDFNLDYGDYTAKYQPLADLGFKPRISGKTSIGKPTKDAPTVYRKNAYDNIFTLNFANDTAPGGIRDFAHDQFGLLDASTKLGLDQLRQALTISDHLPVFATLEFK